MDSSSILGEKRFLTATELEQLIIEEKFMDVGEITKEELMVLRQQQYLLIRVPASKSAKNPYDGHCWTKIEKATDEKPGFRHQPKFSNMTVSDKKAVCRKCTEFNQPNFKKQVLSTDDYNYVYYFMEYGFYSLPSEGEMVKKRLEKHVSKVLNEEVMPYRNLKGSMKAAQEKNIIVSRKQIQNLSRKHKTAVIGKSGPRTVTTLVKAEALKWKYPDEFNFKLDNNELSVQYCHVIPEAIRLFYAGCPRREDFDNWKKSTVEIIGMAKEDRKNRLKTLLSEQSDGLFWPSRLFVDTTFNLTDGYVTLILGESGNFRTKSSGKPRVFPVAYMLHSRKTAENHQKFSEIVRNEFMKQCGDMGDRVVPCVMADGEESLEAYAKEFDTTLIRCDYHILSLLWHNFGKRRVEDAESAIFGTKIGNKWKTGILGSFNETEFDQRLEKAKSSLSKEIYDWLYINQRMLKTSSMASVKLLSGHFLQFSTNNPIETYNKNIKMEITKRVSAEVLIGKLNSICQESITELIYSSLNHSDQVLMTNPLNFEPFETKILKYKALGFLMPTTLAMNVPIGILKNKKFNFGKVADIERKLESIDCLYSDGAVVGLKETDEQGEIRYVQVTKKGHLQCSACVENISDFFCHHLIYVLKNLDNDDDRTIELIKLERFFNKQVVDAPHVPGRSGTKLSDRLGTRTTANNHIRRILDVSDLSMFDSTGDQSMMTIGNTVDTSGLSLSENSELSTSTFVPVQFSTPTPNTNTTSISGISSGDRTKEKLVEIDASKLRFQASGCSRILIATNLSASPVNFHSDLSNKYKYRLLKPFGTIEPLKTEYMVIIKEDGPPGIESLSLYFEETGSGGDSNVEQREQIELISR